MDVETLRLGLGLIVLMMVNISLGSLSALFIQSFDWSKCLRGAIKSVIVIGSFAATYFVGSLNPEIVVINISGIEADVTTAIRIIVLTGYYHYAKQVIEKLGMLINGALFKESVKQPDDGSKKITEVEE